MGDITERTARNKRGTTSKPNTWTAAVLTAIRQVWPNANVDGRDPAGVWATALAGLTSDRMRHGIRELSLTTDAFPPTPGRFRESCLAYRPPENPPLPRVEDRSAKTDAWRACQVSYAKRCTGGVAPPGGAPTTDFDVEYVVMSTPVPKTSALVEHQSTWAKLKENFEREWSQR